jgi:hypothetical protein
MKAPVAYSLLASPIFLALFCGGPALAASPAYCALYAREYASSRIGAPVTTEDASALQRVEDQAYYRCLNQDEAPQFPTTSAYFGQPLEDIAGEGTGPGGPFQALQIHPKAKAAAPAHASATAAGSAADAGTEVADVVTPPASISTRGGHGAQGTPQWVAWCHAHYRSFDEKTGFVLTLTGVKKVCP